MRVQAKILRSLVLLIFGLCLSSLAWAQSSLLTTTDLDCNWKLDGKPQGVLKADDSSVVAVSAGKHLVQATSADGLATFRTVVEVGQGQEMVQISLKAQHQNQAAEADLARHPTWADPATGLMWARKDNGGDVTWQQAANYCQNLTLGSYSGWRMPTIDELAGIYDQTQNMHIKGGIELTWGWTWSGSSGNASGEAWLFTFYRGEQDSIQRDNDNHKRALWVRSSGA